MIHGLFKGLSRQEQIMLAALCLTMPAIVFSWHIGIFAIIIFCGLSSIKTIAFRKTPNYSFAQKICLWSMVAYGLLYVVSATISLNHTEGWFKAGIKAWFIMLPAVCLLSDTSYLSKKQIRAVFQILTAALLLRFTICTLISGVHLLQGLPLNVVFNWTEEPLGMHHNYLALYLDTAIVFLYTQILATPREERRNRWAILIFAAIVLIAYLSLISSRSGIVALALTFFVVLAHLTFFRKKYKAAIITITLAVALIAGLYIAVPSLFDRFVALTTWTENYYPDDRVLAWECGTKATKDHLLFGYGSGDYMPHLVEAFEQRGYKRAIEIGYNTHNEYIETVLQTGLFGLAILLFMLFAPMIAAIYKRPRSLPTVLIIIVISSMCLFEAMLNRQMGSQFIALVYCLLIISMRPSHSDAS